MARNLTLPAVTNAALSATCLQNCHQTHLKTVCVSWVCFVSAVQILSMFYKLELCLQLDLGIAM